MAKSLQEIKTELKDALLNWGYIQYNPRNRPGEKLFERSGKGGSKVPMTPRDMKQATYELYWNIYSGSLQENWRQAIEMRYLRHFSRKRVAEAMGVEEETISSYCSMGISTVADRIFERRKEPGTCPRCGGTLYVDQGETTQWDIQIKCYNCSRSLERIEQEGF